MDKETYYELLAEVIGACLDEDNDHEHAVLISYNSKNGQVKTYSINAPYDIVRVLIETAALIVTDDKEERVIN